MGYFNNSFTNIVIMKNLVLFTFLIFTITGLLTPSIFSSSFASPEDAPGRSEGTKTANGCDKGTAKNNPNCNTSPPTISVCDFNEDGIITTSELKIILPTETDVYIQNYLIYYAEYNAKGKANGVIDTAKEITELNLLLSPPYQC